MYLEGDRMNEFPNSIRNNMVNTTWPSDAIKINKTPEVNVNYKVEREESSKFKSALVVAAIAAVAFAYTAGVSYAQHQSMEQNTAVVATEMLPGGAKLNVTENPAYSYIVTPNGDAVSNYNGIDAQDLAKNYSNDNTSGKHM